jgi:hypothetical protein
MQASLPLSPCGGICAIANGISPTRAPERTPKKSRISNSSSERRLSRGSFISLFVVIQVMLVAAGRTDLHRRMGWIGAVFAANIVVFGALLTIHSVRINDSTRTSQMPALLINGIIDLVLFCLFSVSRFACETCRQYTKGS